MTQTNVPYIITSNSIVLFINGVQNTIDKSHLNYSKLLEVVKKGEWDKVKPLLSNKTIIDDFGEGSIFCKDSEIFYKHAKHGDVKVDNALTKKIIRMIGEGFDAKPMIRFLENLLSNPSMTAVQELYNFLEKGKLPLTEDGHFLAYKKVKEDFKDIYTGLMDNSPGSRPSMPRYEVDDNRNNTCSKGLHFCSFEYLSHYGTGPGSKTVVLKINPRDVVSIPSDYNNTKGRACEYEVLYEYDYASKKDKLADQVVTDKNGKNEDLKTMILDLKDELQDQVDGNQEISDKIESILALVDKT